MRCFLKVLLAAILGLAVSPAQAQTVEIKGKLRADVFHNIGGVALAGLTGSPKFPDSPDNVVFVDAFEYPPGAPDGTPPPNDVFNNYGARVYGWITPAETARYVFYLAADDNAELWLSTDDKPENRVLIATEPQWNPVRAWDSTARRPGCPDNGGARCENVSAPVSLRANTKYFVEMMFKEGGGGDNGAVTWIKEGGLAPAAGDPPALFGNLLSAPAAATAAIRTEPVDAKQEIGKKVTFTAQINAVFNPTLQWLKNGQPIAGATSLSFTTANLTAADNGAKYKLRVTAGTSTVESREALLTVVPVAKEVSPGFLKVEVFTGIGGVSLDGNLRVDDKYVSNTPDRIEYVTLFEYPAGTPTTAPPGNVFDNYGVRVTGFIAPKETATYIFALATDDNGELYLSTNENPANEILIASEPTWNPVRAFASTDRRPGCPDFCENISGPIRLEAGKRYWVRAEMKEGGGGDNLAVAWRKDSDPPFRNGGVPILGSFLATEANPGLASDITITEQPKAVTVVAPEKATFSVKATINPPISVAYRWQKNGVDIPGATEATYTTDFLSVSDNAAKIRAVVSVPGRSVNSDEVTLTVSPDTQPPRITKILGSDLFNRITVTFNEPITEATASNKANYALSGGLSVDSVTILDKASVRLSTSKQAVDTQYTLTISNLRDTSNNVSAAPNNTKTFRSFKFTPGLVKWEVWSNINGNAPTDLTNDPRYPDSPSITRFLPAFEAPTGFAELFGARLSAFITPKETASYVFLMSSDDNGELWLSTNDDPANKKLIAIEPQWNGFRAWASQDRRPGCPDACDNVSQPVRLEAGKRYYAELLYKEGLGGDNGEATWIKQGQPIPANGTASTLKGDVVGVFTDPSQGPPTITRAPADLCPDPGSNATLTVEASGTEPFTYQWKFNGKNIEGATSASLSLANAGAAHVGSYSVEVKNAEGATTSTPANLFIKGTLFIEAEDFNFDGGNYVKDKPIGMSGKYPGGDYANRGGIEKVDWNAPGGNAAQPYRPDTGVAAGKRNAHADGLPRCDFVVDVNHVVGWNDAGDWYNYTRQFPEPARAYNVVGRLSSGDQPINFQLDQVTAGAKTPTQTLSKLGVFKPGRATAGWDIMEFFPLTDDQGKTVTVTLGGESTLRLTTNPGHMDVDYLMVIPAGAPAPTGPRIGSVTRDGTNVRIVWEGGGTLEASDSITGPWAAVANAASPATVPISGNNRFFRLRR